MIFNTKLNYAQIVMIIYEILSLFQLIIIIFLISIQVDTEEIKRLGKRFKKLDIDGSGALSKDEFMQIHDLQQNPLVQRVIDLFDTDGNGEVDFKEFIEGISQFSVKGDKEAKLKCKLLLFDDFMLFIF